MNLMPSALRLSMRMPRKLRNSSVDIARMTSGPLDLGEAPSGMPVAQLVGAGEEAVAQAGVFLLVADLLEDVGQQVLGLLVVGLGVDELVEDFRGEQVLALVVELPGLVRGSSRAAHHLDVERGGVRGRERDQASPDCSPRSPGSG